MVLALGECGCRGSTADNGPEHGSRCAGNPRDGGTNNRNKGPRLSDTPELPNYVPVELLFAIIECRNILFQVRPRMVDTGAHASSPGAQHLVAHLASDKWFIRLPPGGTIIYKYTTLYL